MSIDIIRDLRPKFGPPRDQGQRPTCLAFAASDGHAACRTPWTPLSCEYVYFHAVRRYGGNPHGGVDLPSMFGAIEHDGQPLEDKWPYLANLPANLAHWRPPTDAGALLKARGAQVSGGVPRIAQSLDDGRPLLIGMSISDAFYMPDEGAVITRVEAVDPARRHAVLAVAYGTAQSERYILVRNSWGRLWGDNGHAWISETYLTPRIVELASIERAG